MLETSVVAGLVALFTSLIVCSLFHWSVLREVRTLGNWVDDIAQKTLQDRARRAAAASVAARASRAHEIDRAIVSAHTGVDLAQPKEADDWMDTLVKVKKFRDGGSSTDH